MGKLNYGDPDAPTKYPYINGSHFHNIKKLDMSV